MTRVFALLAAVAAAGSATFPALAASDDKDWRITIVNDSSQAIYYLYGHPYGITPWLEDMLGNETI